MRVAIPCLPVYLCTCLRGRLVLLQIHHPDERQVAIVLVEVEAVAKDKFVGDGEAAIMDGDDGLAALGLVEQGADFETLRLARLEQFQHRGDGVAAVYDIFHEQDVLVVDVGQQVHRHADVARAFARARAIG